MDDDFMEWRKFVHYTNMLICILAVIMVLVFLYGIQDALHERSLDDTEKQRYKDNLVVQDMSIETYNKSYDELTYEEKQHIIRLYRIDEHNDRAGTYVMPVPIMVH